MGAAASQVLALQAQWQHAEKRRADLEDLGKHDATSLFNVQDATAQAATLKAQLLAAQAQEASAQLAATSEIDGENTTVAQLEAQLDEAKWELDQTTVRAPADGYATALTLAVGDRALTSKSAMSFIVRFAHEYRLPPELFWLLLGLTLLSMAALGYQLGLSGKPVRVLVLLLTAMWTLVTIAATYPHIFDCMAFVRWFN